MGVLAWVKGRHREGGFFLWGVMKLYGVRRVIRGSVVYTRTHDLTDLLSLSRCQSMYQKRRAVRLGVGSGGLLHHRQAED
jgi:hypothetical protein